MEKDNESEMEWVFLKEREREKHKHKRVKESKIYTEYFYTSASHPISPSSFSSYTRTHRHVPPQAHSHTKTVNLLLQASLGGHAKVLKGFFLHWYLWTSQYSLCLFRTCSSCNNSSRQGHHLNKTEWGIAYGHYIWKSEKIVIQCFGSALYPRVLRLFTMLRGWFTWSFSNRWDQLGWCMAAIPPWKTLIAHQSLNSIKTEIFGQLKPQSIILKSDVNKLVNLSWANTQHRNTVCVAGNIWFRIRSIDTAM